MIREFRSSDMDSIIDIWLRASVEAHGFISSEYWAQKVQDMREKYIPASRTFIYIDSDEVVSGFISLVDNYIAALFVTPDKQGRGIGRELLGHVKAIEKELKLAVYTRNIKARKFYEHEGFSPVSIEIDLDTGEEELVMRYNKS